MITKAKNGLSIRIFVTNLSQSVIIAVFGGFLLVFGKKKRLCKWKGV